MKPSTLIVPTLNEAENIKRLIPLLSRLYPKLYILIVDDGSRDGTLEAVKRLAKQYERLSFIDRKNAKCKGLSISVLAGLKQVKTPNFAVMDADFQHPPEKLGELLNALEYHDLAIGTRSATPGWKFSRKWISKIANLAASLRLKLSGNPYVKDPMSGFFAARLSVVKALLSKNPRGFKILFDILKRLPKSTKVVQIGFVFALRKAGKSKLSVNQCKAFLKALFS